jgi:2'-hydroxyisoflavone reductase
MAGTYDAVGPHRPTAEVVEEIASVVGFDGELVPLSSEQLAEVGVNPWAGPRSLPLWLPPGYEGMGAHDPAPSVAAGMPVTPFADVVRNALARERELGLNRERKAGLTPAEEEEVLAKS